jgi:hypothetical protein
MSSGTFKKTKLQYFLIKIIAPRGNRVTIDMLVLRFRQKHSEPKMLCRLPCDPFNIHGCILLLEEIVCAEDSTDKPGRQPRGNQYFDYPCNLFAHPQNQPCSELIIYSPELCHKRKVPARPAGLQELFRLQPWQPSPQLEKA